MKRKLLQRIVAVLLTAAMCLGLTLSNGLGGPFVVQAANETNYFVNGDFETTEGADYDGDPVNWTVSVGEGSTWGAYEVKNDEWASDGSNLFLHMINYTGSGDLPAVATQTVSLGAGTYTATIQSAGENQGSSSSDLKLTAVSNGTTLASSNIALDGWDAWKTAAITFTLESESQVTVGVTGTLADSSYCDLDNATLAASTDEEDTTEEENTEGYAVTVASSTTVVKAGDTVTLNITVKNNGQSITDLSAAGLNISTWLDYWDSNGHGDGNDDAVISSANGLSTAVTLPSEGTYYLVTELYDSSWAVLAKYTTTFIVQAGGDEEDTSVEAEINVEKVSGLSDDFIMGVDISSVISEFESGVVYYDFEGNKINNIKDFCKFLAECGVTTVRVRIWNNPFDSNDNGYGGGNNDVNAAIEIANGCAAAGLDMLLDFHCSDFWTDPSKQQAPKAWENYTVTQKAEALKAFITDTLNKIAATGANIAMVQVGNETTGGFIGETNTTNMCTLFNAGAEAIRSFGSSIKVVIHVTNPEKSTMTTWAQILSDNGVDYDVLATSYYPSWHGTFANLTSQLSTVRNTYDKDVMVVETSYAYTLNDTDGHTNTICEGSNDDMMCETQYPFTVQGQANYLRDLISAVSTAGGLGVCYWEPAWITVGDTTGLSGAEYDAQVEENKDLWETYGSGWASSYSATYDPDDAGVWYGGSAVDNQALFAADGTALYSINVWKYVRTGAISVLTSVDAISSPTETIAEGGAYTLPDTVTVTYNSGEKEEAVVWDAKDVSEINVNAPGTYVVNGTVTFSEAVDSGDYAGKTTASTTYTLTVEYTNLIGDDWSFENGSANFSGLDSTGKGIDGETPYDGSYCLHWYLTSEGTSQVIYLGEDNAGITLEPGKYTFELKAQGEVGDTVLLSILDHNSGSVIAAGDEVALTGWNNWHTPSVSFTIEETTVVDLKMTIGIQAKGWGTIDCMYLYNSGLRVTTLIQEGAPQAELNISDEELVSAGIVDSAELADGKVIVSLKVAAVDEIAAAAEIQKIDEEAKEYGYSVGMYFDMTLWKIVNSVTTQLTDLNSTITVCVTIPESLRAEGRTYAIARFHSDEVTLIEGVYDSSTGEYTFETDAFSTYAIVYKDTASADDSDTDTTVTPVNTGDKRRMFPFIVLTASSMGIVGVDVLRRRRRANKI